MRELLDGQMLDGAALAANLREIRLINRSLGWTPVTVRLLERLANETCPRAFRYLDVATGSGDLPLAVLRRTRRHGRQVAAIGLDSSPKVLAAATAYLRGTPVTLQLGDARALPFADRSIDLVSCALALHHFPPQDAVRVLRELARVARHAWLVVDLERSLPAYLGALALRLLLRSPVTRQDAPASVLRAYTRAELRDLLALAGLEDAYVGTRAPFRLVAASRPV